MTAFFLDWAEQFGYLGIVFALVLTGAGLPIPEELFVVLAGILAAGGNYPWLGFAACMLGCLLGDSIMYVVGYRFGRGLISRHPRLAAWFHADREKWLEGLIARHGWKAFFVARFLVGVRCPMYLATGMMRVPPRTFFLWDGVSATVVVGLFFWSSYFFGEPIVQWIKVLQGAEKIATGVVLLVIAAGAAWWWRGRARAAAAIAPPKTTELPEQGPPVRDASD